MDNREIVAAAAEGTSRYLGERATKVLDAIMGEFGKDLYAHVGARWMAWKCSNIEKLLDRVDELLKEAGGSPSKVAEAAVVPTLEAAANVDDPSLSEMFANLLVSAAQQKPNATHPAFPGMISAMSSDDAKVLKVFADWMDKPAFKNSELNVVAEMAGLVVGPAIVSIGNLTRLGLLQLHPSKFTSGQTMNHDDPMHETWTITAFGGIFVQACVKPVQKSGHISQPTTAFR